MEENILRAVIIDDEPNSRRTLKTMLNRYCDLNIIGEAGGVSSGVELIKNLSPNLIFLDIKMNDGTGFDLLKQIELKDFQIIFTTAYDQFAIKAIKYSALDYLLKPIDIEELQTAVNKAENAINTSNISQVKQLNVLVNNNFNPESMQKIVFSTAEGMHIIEIKKIIRCEADDYYTRIFVEGRKLIMISKTLKEVDKMLSNHTFVRVHKTHLANVDYIKTYVKSGGGYLIMTNGVQIPVSRRKREVLMEALGML